MMATWPGAQRPGRYAWQPGDRQERPGRPARIVIRLCGAAEGPMVSGFANQMRAEVAFRRSARDRWRRRRVGADVKVMRA